MTTAHPNSGSPTPAPGYDWETCMTMNGTWGYKSYDHDWKSTENLIRKLVDIASKGGNFLLNVGPTAEGIIPQPSADRLAAMGDWLKVNGDSIYATTASPFAKPDWGRYTKKPGKLFAHVFDWPEDKRLSVPVPGRPRGPRDPVVQGRSRTAVDCQVPGSDRCDAAGHSTRPDRLGSGHPVDGVTSWWALIDFPSVATKFFRCWVAAR